MIKSAAIALVFFVIGIMSAEAYVLYKESKSPFNDLNTDNVGYFLSVINVVVSNIQHKNDSNTLKVACSTYKRYLTQFSTTSKDTEIYKSIIELSDSKNKWLLQNGYCN